MVLPGASHSSVGCLEWRQWKEVAPMGGAVNATHNLVADRKHGQSKAEQGRPGGTQNIPQRLIEQLLDIADKTHSYNYNPKTLLS